MIYCHVQINLLEGRTQYEVLVPSNPLFLYDVCSFST